MSSFELNCWNAREEFEADRLDGMPEPWPNAWADAGLQRGDEPEEKSPQFGGDCGLQEERKNEDSMSFYADWVNYGENEHVQESQ